MNMLHVPYSYSEAWRAFRRAAAQAGIAHISSHSFRHTFRSWLDVVGTPLGVQQRLMRHTDIRTTMSYGTSAEGDMRQAHEKIVRLALIPTN
jgi:integrase